MEHSSYPGFYDAPLSADGERRMARIADIMIPAADGFPPAGPLVTHFVSERIDPAERDLLEDKMQALEDLSDEAVTAWVSGLETGDPDTFVILRNWVYYGYYSSGAVASAIQLSGSPYHGAPQPFGYRIAEEAPVPTAPRGSCLRTEEIRRVV
jgi:hypothetical protein